MSLQISLDREANRPLYRQIADQILSQIANAQLPPGTRLPTIRQLSLSLGVTRLTVQSAYEELQAEGWIESTVGRGTFVTGAPETRSVIARMGRRINPDGVLSDMLQVTQVAGALSLAIAEPDPTLFPTDEFWDSLIGLRDERSALLRYSSPQGDPALRIALATLLQEREIEVVPDEIIVTAGGTQGLALIAQALARPGDTVAVEQPTFLGMLHILRSHGIRAVGIPLDDEGPQLDRLEQIVVRERPRFFYTIPSYQNPTGICMSPARRSELLALAERYRLPIVEDDIYNRLSYDDPTPRPLKADDRNGLVIHLDGVSKVLLPGLRIGYVVAPPLVRERMLSLRRAADLCGPPLVQRALAEFLQRGKLKPYLRRVLPRYRERRDALLSALQSTIPPGVTWTRPRGGFCCWLTLPAGDATKGLYQAALQRGVVVTPGEVCLVEPDGFQHLRLCFGSAPIDLIREAVSRLGKIIEERLEQQNSREQYASTWRALV